jgi:RNA polymerase sigma factor for flagellar operon FliA
MPIYKEQIVLADYYDLVKKIAHHLRGSLPDHFAVEDMIQDGMVGLLKARDTFCYSKGVPFEGYAYLKIRGSILDSVRKSGFQSRGYSKQSKAIYGETIKFENINGRKPSDKELSEMLGISLDKLQAFYKEANSMKVMSFDDIDVEDDSQCFDQSVLIAKVLPALKTLNENEQLVMSLYFVEDLNLREIAEVLGVSEPRVYQIKGKALAKIQGFILNK